MDSTWRTLEMAGLQESCMLGFSQFWTRQHKVMMSSMGGHHKIMMCSININVVLLCSNQHPVFEGANGYLLKNPFVMSSIYAFLTKIFLFTWTVSCSSFKFKGSPSMIIGFLFTSACCDRSYLASLWSWSGSENQSRWIEIFWPEKHILMTSQKGF